MICASPPASQPPALDGFQSASSGLLPAKLKLIVRRFRHPLPSLGMLDLQPEDIPCYKVGHHGSYPTINQWLRSGPLGFERHAPAMTKIKEGADYGSDQTQYTGNGRRGRNAGRSAASVCSAGGARRNCQILRERPRSYPL